MDANGFAKVRPVVVVSPTAEIATGKPVQVVAIATRLPATLPDDHVLLPCDPQGRRAGPQAPVRGRGGLAGGDPGRVRATGGRHPVMLTIIGELLAKVCGYLTLADSVTHFAEPSDKAAKILEGPQTASPPAAEEDQGKTAGEIA